MNKRKLVLSVIIPVYNVEKYLEDCLDSLINQNISDEEYEIICVNDGSTDRSGIILENYAKKHQNILVFNKSNGGVSSARNCGIDHAKGEYIWFVDADDFISTNVLSGICNKLELESPDLLFVKPIAFDDSESAEKYKNKVVKEDETTKEYGDWLWTRIINRNIIKNSGVYFNTDISLAEDHMFCTMLNPYIKKIVSIDRVLYFYRKRPNSASTEVTIKKMDKIIASSKAFLDAAENGTIDYNVGMQEVYVMMLQVISTIAKLPLKEANVWLDKVKKLRLFPLKKPTGFKIEYSTEGLNSENKILTDLKYKSYTLSGYYKLRIFRFILKIKRAIKK